MSNLSDLLELLLDGLQAGLALAISFVKAHPVQAGLMVFAMLRLFGTTVQTGYKGVLFVFGRVRRELEPGFHPLLPLVMTARKTPVRSVTLDLAPQRLTTAEGLVYDVQATIVYRVADSKLALTQIDNLRKGIETILPLIVEELLRGQTQVGVLDGKALDAQLIARAEQKLQRWGVAVEQAGFKSIAPTKKTLRLTQLATLSNERQRVHQELVGKGVSVNSAAALLGRSHRLIGHAAARYHALDRPARLALAAEWPTQTPSPLPGAEPTVAEMPPKPGRAGAPETMEHESADSGIATAPSPARPKKAACGVKPRSWLRLQSRLRPRQARQTSGMRKADSDGTK
jgi:SPFH domain / Band 7 family